MLAFAATVATAFANLLLDSVAGLESDAKLAGARVAAEAEALRVLKDYGVSVARGKESKE
jgi:hypothetical protein